MGENIIMKFLCGTYFKHQCRNQLSNYKDARQDEFSYIVDHDLENDYFFCKPEKLSLFSTYVKIGAIKLPEQFVLVTHNSDINFDKEKIEYVLDLFPNISHWYTQNLLFDHPKVKPIPIGIANPKWSHGNQERFLNISSNNLEKNNTVYANFNVSTNFAARKYCIEQLGSEHCLKLEKNYPNASSIKEHDDFVNSTQENYLSDIAQSYFTVSPIGNGVDCHKTWESIYMKSVPIVQRWHGVEKFKELGIPLLIINDWSEFKDLDLCKNLYEDTWGDFNPSDLTFKLFQ